MMTSKWITLPQIPRRFLSMMVLLMLGSGCQGPTIVCKVDTEIRSDNSTLRKTSYTGMARPDRNQPPVPIVLSRYLRIPEEKSYEKWAEAPGRLAFSGTFPSPDTVPIDFAKLTPASELWSQNRISMKRRNYVFFEIYDFEEAIDDIVERDESEESLQIAVQLINEIIIGVLESQFKEQYDLTGLTTWLRKTLPSLSASLYQTFWEIRRSQHGPIGRTPNEPQEWDLRLRKELERFGLTLEPLLDGTHKAENEILLWAFLDEQLKAGVKARKQGTPPLTSLYFKTPENQKLLLKQLEVTLTTQFGSVGDFPKKINPLIPVVLGAYFGRQVSLAQDSPSFVFFYRLHLPGTIIQTNGTKDLDGSLLWRFNHAAVMLTGYRMWARTLSVNQEAINRLNLQGFPGNIEMIERFHLALVGKDDLPAPPLVALLEACVASGSLKPLQDAALPGRAVTGIHPEVVRGILGVLGAYYRPDAALPEKASKETVPASETPATPPTPPLQPAEREEQPNEPAVQPEVGEEHNPDSLTNRKAPGLPVNDPSPEAKPSAMVKEEQSSEPPATPATPEPLPKNDLDREKAAPEMDL